MNAEYIQPKGKNLIIHQIVHRRVKSYDCNKYEKAFIQKPSLIRHQRSHTGAKPYACKEGEKAFDGKWKFVFERYPISTTNVQNSPGRSYTSLNITTFR